ncbi:RICIN domain-containing protein [Streptomyces sp. NPDC001292]|uniref:RICIN domain-containing protein n=1 Tax=Streptomyces sp. NPDC001292 TaxID=3364558 RepID=UPI0036A71B37
MPRRAARSVSPQCRSRGCSRWVSGLRRWPAGQDEVWTLKNQATGRCLDDSDAYGLRSYFCNASTFQSWKIRRWNDGTRELKSQATGRCVDDSDAYGLRAYPCNATPFQSW